MGLSPRSISFVTGTKRGVKIGKANKFLWLFGCPFWVLIVFIIHFGVVHTPMLLKFS